MYDLIILGGGPAGLTAALYAGRYGLNFVVISKDIGGMANYAAKVENFPNFIGSGIELTQGMKKQAEKFGAVISLDEVIDVQKKGEEFIVKSQKKEYKSKSLIIALGTKRKKLNVIGEERLAGKGVSYCATCDGFFFKDKIIAVVGGRDSCANTSLMLADICKKVYLIYRGKELKCINVYQKQIMGNKKIEKIFNAVPIEVKGKEKVESLVYEQGGGDKDKTQESEIKIDGLFFEIGSLPSTSSLDKLKLKKDKEGWLIVNEEMETNISGVYACGDVTKHSLKQIITACSQGAVAVKSVNEYLKKFGD